MEIFVPSLFEGQTFVVIGASSGLGRAVSCALGAHGASLALVGRDSDRLEQTRASLAGKGRAYVHAIRNADGMSECIKQIAADNGPLAGVFHGAGVELVRPAKLTKDEHVASVFEAATLGALGIARAAASKNVLADGGSIVFMSSVAGLRGQTGMTAYSAAKAAIDGLTRSLACELAPRKIRVNSIVAAAVDTEMHRRLVAGLTPEGVASYRARHLLDFGTVDDVSNAALFLLSPGAGWVTGTSMVVDGGYLAH